MMPPPAAGAFSFRRSEVDAMNSLKITRLKSNRKVRALNSHVCAFRHPKTRQMTGRAIA
ncbi:hypothetical protein CBM2588_A40326 [Cupriavidus taiwanensis]|nr:hypothetical protein CBM2588_A40326 [Cupriavidus taiwanensis]